MVDNFCLAGSGGPCNSQKDGRAAGGNEFFNAVDEKPVDFCIGGFERFVADLLARIEGGLFLLKPAKWFTSKMRQDTAGEIFGPMEENRNPGYQNKNSA